MQSELLNCPFCGGEAMIAATLDDMYRPMCKTDGCAFLESNVTRAEAIAAWNTRASDAEITRLTEALRAAEEQVKELREAVISAAEWLRNAPLESGVCCCGDPIETHGYYSGHSPVDAVAYSAMQLRDELLAALKGPSHDDA